MEDLQKTIREVVEKFQKGSFENEQAVCQGAVLPILRACGWNTENPQEVTPQYKTQQNTFVDYALFLEKKPLLLIEVKQSLRETASRRHAIGQLLSYAHAEGVDIAVLTDGDIWAFYWPSANERDYGRRLAIEVQISQDLPSSSAIIWRYLHRKHASFRQLRRYIEADYAVRKIRQLWQALLQEPTEALLSLLEEEADKAHIPISRDQIRAFLQQQADLTHSKKEMHGPSPPSNSLGLKRFGINSPQQGYYFKGQFHKAGNIRKAYPEIIEKLILMYPTFAESFSEKTKGSK
jgi:hypothetical protein